MLEMDMVPVNQPTDTFTARLLPITTTILATFLTLEPVHLPGYSTLTPDFTLMTVYHWLIYRPDLLPPLGLFGIGVAYDLLSGGPPGITPILFLLSRAAVLRWRRWFLNRPFPFIWSGFIVLACGAMLGLWALHCALTLQLTGLSEGVLRTVLTIALAPISSSLLGRIQYALIGAGE